MNNQLIIRFTDQEEIPVEWLSVDPEISRYDSGSGGYETLDKLHQPTSLTLLLPTQWIIFEQYDLPTRNPQQALLAARSMIEENLIGEIEEMHVVIQPLADGKTQVSAIQRDTLREALEILSSHGLSADLVTADCLLLPFVENGWSIYDSNEGLLVRSTALSGIFYDIEWLEQLDPEHLFDFTEQLPVNINYYHHGDKPVLDFMELFPDAECKNLQIDEQLDFLEYFSRNQFPDSLTNLLTGEFLPKKSIQYAWMNWRLPVYIMAASLLMFSLLLSILNQAQEARSDNLQQQIVGEFKSLFPDVPIADYMGHDALLLQIKRELSKQSSQSKQRGQHTLLSLYRVLSVMKQQGQVSLLHLSYSRGIYTLDIISTDASAAQLFVNQINKTDSLQAKILVNSANKDNPQSRIQIVEKRDV